MTYMVVSFSLCLGMTSLLMLAMCPRGARVPPCFQRLSAARGMPPCPLSPVSRLCRLVAATARRRLYRGVVALAEPLGAGARVNEGSEVFSGQSRE